MDAAKKQELKRFINELKSIRGRHTELVSVYIPAGYDLNKIISHLQEEQGTAKNIKDAKTRGNVIDSLERCVRHLRLFKKTPPNGLAVFAGNVAAQEGKVDIKIWSIEPPEPLNIRIYRCDQRFVLDILEEMREHKEVYGLILIDRREATLGLLKGSNISMLTDVTSGVPGKFKAGGQSAARFERLIHGMAIEFFKRVSDLCNKEYLPMKNLKGILLGGPGPTKEEFQQYLNNELAKKIIAVQDVTYTDESGLHHLVDKSADILQKEGIIAEKKLMEKFFTLLAKEPGKATYGEQEVRRVLSLGAVDTVLISENYDDKIMQEIEDLVKASGATIHIISVDIKEGQQLRELGGIAAILRFAVHSD